MDTAEFVELWRNIENGTKEMRGVGSSSGDTYLSPLKVISIEICLQESYSENECLKDTDLFNTVEPTTQIEKDDTIYTIITCFFTSYNGFYEINSKVAGRN